MQGCEPYLCLPGSWKHPSGHRHSFEIGGDRIPEGNSRLDASLGHPRSLGPLRCVVSAETRHDPAARGRVLLVVSLDVAIEVVAKPVPRWVAVGKRGHEAAKHVGNHVFPAVGKGGDDPVGGA